MQPMSNDKYRSQLTWACEELISYIQEVYSLTIGECDTVILWHGHLATIEEGLQEGIFGPTAVTELPRSIVGLRVVITHGMEHAPVVCSSKPLGGAVFCEYKRLRDMHGSMGGQE